MNLQSAKRSAADNKMLIYIGTTATDALEVLYSRAVPSTQVAQAYSSSKSSSFIFELEYLIIFCKRQTAIKTGKPLAQKFVTQLRDKFSLAWDDANQFRDCPGHTVGPCRVPG